MEQLLHQSIGNLDSSELEGRQLSHGASREEHKGELKPLYLTDR